MSDRLRIIGLGVVTVAIVVLIVGLVAHHAESSDRPPAPAPSVAWESGDVRGEATNPDLYIPPPSPELADASGGPSMD